MHTHPKMKAFFSDEDDQDEKGFRLYGTLASPEGVFNDYAFRLGVYGYYLPAYSFEFSEVDLHPIENTPEQAHE
jgi:hypothetical protein